MAATAISWQVRRFLYGKGDILQVILWLYIAVMSIFIIPLGFIREARKEARLKAKREEEARKDRERLERVRREERE